MTEFLGLLETDLSNLISLYPEKAFCSDMQKCSILLKKTTLANIFLIKHAIKNVPFLHHKTNLKC